MTENNSLTLLMTFTSLFYTQQPKLSNAFRFTSCERTLTGALGEIRTPNLYLRRVLLYPLSYKGITGCFSVLTNNPIARSWHHRYREQDFPCIHLITIPFTNLNELTRRPKKPWCIGAREPASLPRVGKQRIVNFEW